MVRKQKIRVLAYLKEAPNVKVVLGYCTSMSKVNSIIKEYQDVYGDEIVFEPLKIVTMLSYEEGKALKALLQGLFPYQYKQNPFYF